MNNYDFWEKYLMEIKDKILEICSKKDNLQIDMHMHSNYSADGKQTVKEIIDNTNNCGFDIISITDHDTLDAYNELYEIVKTGITTPIIIPGIEFTIDNREYGNQCHMLQLFVNPKDSIILENVNQNYKATFNRSKIQFNRIKHNMALQEILKENKITISYKDYITYLNEKKLFPEYDTLCSYLMSKFIEFNITTYDILEKLEKFNIYDIYEDRKKYKEERYKKLRKKYIVNEDNNKSVRFLLSMLAVREVDDDWWNPPACGSLSVNSYGQLKVDNLNKKYYTFFAHPTESSLDIVEEIIKSNKKIIGMEHNIRNDYIDINRFDSILLKYKLNKIIGSDSHDNTNQFYNNLNFYKIKSSEFTNIINNVFGGNLNE